MAPGTYFERIDFGGREVTACGSGGAAATTIDGENGGTVVLFEHDDGPGAVLEGFTVTHGRDTGHGAGITCDGASPTIRRCVVRDNYGKSGGIYSADGSPRVEACEIRENRAKEHGGGFSAKYGGAPVLENCLIVLNTADALGGGGDDEARGIAVDGDGHAVVAGHTDSSQSSFPVAVGPDLTFAAQTDAFVAKVRADGTGLVWCGYVGGNEIDYAEGVGVGPDGDVVVAGFSDSSDLPVAGGPGLSPGGGRDGFVAKVAADGTSLRYCGYLGGDASDSIWDVAVDLDGNAYVAGSTNSDASTFPLLVGPDLVCGGGSSDVGGFVAKVDPGGALVWCGYIAGAARDFAQGVAVDRDGNAYVAGQTESDDASFPGLVGPPPTYSGKSDAFVAKVRADGTAFEYLGYLGGSECENGYDIAVDGSGAACVVGNTKSSDFPVAGPLDPTRNGNIDVFVAKVRPDGTALAWAGFLGGSSDDGGYAVAADGAGNVYVTGGTFSSSSSFPQAVGPQLEKGGAWDAFVARVDAAGNRLDFCTYHGGAEQELGHAIAVDGRGGVYFAGEVWTADMGAATQAGSAGSTVTAALPFTVADTGE